MRASGETFDYERPARHADLRRAARIDGGAATLEVLRKNLAEATGLEVRIPGWTRDRKLVFSAPETSAGALLDGLCLLYGWELTHGRREEWRLDRPPFVPVRDCREIHAALRRIVPPILKLPGQLRGRSPTEEDGNLALAGRYRRAYEFAVIQAAISRKLGRDWKNARIGDLDAATQRLVANHLCRLLLTDVLSEARTTEPRLHFMHPELGQLELVGQPGPGQHPNVFFMVETHVPPNITRKQGWGWIVRSSSLDN